VKNTAKYVLGPVGLEKISAPLSPLVDFSAGAEVAMGNYQTADGIAALILIEYPTPQLAAEHLRQIDAAKQAHAPAQTGGSMAIAGPIFDKRTGPSLRSPPARFHRRRRALLNGVNYEACHAREGVRIPHSRKTFSSRLARLFCPDRCSAVQTSAS